MTDVRYHGWRSVADLIFNQQKQARPNLNHWRVRLDPKGRSLSAERLFFAVPHAIFREISFPHQRSGLWGWMTLAIVLLVGALAVGSLVYIGPHSIQYSAGNVPISATPTGPTSANSVLADAFMPQMAMRRYLVLFSDSRMLRPFGGFLSTYAMLDVGDQKISVSDYGSLYNLDAGFSQQFIPPPALAGVANVWSLHDADWLTDFNQASDAMRFMLQKNNYPALDGIWVVSTQAISDFIQRYGPLNVDGQHSIQAQDVASIFGDVWEQDLKSSISKPNLFLSGATQSFFEKLNTLSLKDRADFLNQEIARGFIYDSLRAIAGTTSQQQTAGQNFDQQISVLDLGHTIFQNNPSLTATVKFGVDNQDILEKISLQIPHILNPSGYLYVKVSLPSGFLLESASPGYAVLARKTFAANLQDYFSAASSTPQFFHDDALDADIFVNSSGISIGKLIRAQDAVRPIMFSLRWKSGALMVPQDFSLRLAPNFNNSISVSGSGISVDSYPETYAISGVSYPTGGLKIHLGTVFGSHP